MKIDDEAAGPLWSVRRPCQPATVYFAEQPVAGADRCDAYGSKLLGIGSGAEGQRLTSQSKVMSFALLGMPGGISICARSGLSIP